MEKILLINPPSSLEGEFGVLAAGGSFRPPLQLAALAACLRESGYQVEILDCMPMGLGYREALEHIKEGGAQYLGITATTLTIYNAAKLAKMVKEETPQTKIIIGGVHATLLPEDTLRRFPQFDLGVVGEGEYTLPEVIRAFEKEGTFHHINGIVYRDNGSIRTTEKRPFLKELDRLPLPAWDLLPNLTRFYQPALIRHVQLPAAYVITARGCPHQCTFCAGRATLGRLYRTHSIDYVFVMIKKLQKDYCIRDITFYDEVLTANKRRINSLCDRFMSEKLGLTWSCDARVDTVDLPLLKRMKAAGCGNISYGIESGSQKILDEYKKGITVEQIKNALNWTREAGIISSGFFMFGAPSETRETMQETVDLLKEIELDYFTPFFFGPQPGDDIYPRAKELGQFEDDWSKMNGVNLIFIPNNVTRQDMEWYFKKALLTFYLRPKTIINFIKQINSLSYLRRLIRGGIGFLSIMCRRTLTKS